MRNCDQRGVRARYAKEDGYFPHGWKETAAFFRNKLPINYWIDQLVFTLGHPSKSFGKVGDTCLQR